MYLLGLDCYGILLLAVFVLLKIPDHFLFLPAIAQSAILVKGNCLLLLNMDYPKRHLYHCHPLDLEGGEKVSTVVANNYDCSYFFIIFREYFFQVHQA